MSGDKLNPILDHLGDLPPLLYKYRTFDKHLYWQKMATQGQVFFASARRFNDPFDCYFVPISNAMALPKDELIEHIKVVTKQHYPNASRKRRRELERIALKRAKKYRKNPQEIMRDVLRVQYSAFGVLPLTPRFDSLPMWAYYSSDHSGLCIGLLTQVIGSHQERLVRRKKLLDLYKVLYPDDVPIVNVDIDHKSGITEDERNEIARTFYTKSSAWKHEDEYRAILWDYSDKAYSFGTEAVGEVIVGARANNKDIKSLLVALRKAGSSAKVKRARRAHDRYALVFEIIA